VTNEEKRQRTKEIGEQILDRFLLEQGLVRYRPDPNDGAHPFDRLAASRDKRQIVIGEVKTKPRRQAYADTGINRRHFDDYMHNTTKYGLPLFLAFVDFEIGAMYGNWWSELIKTRESDIPKHGLDADGVIRCETYPWEQNSIVYFPLSAMRTYYMLTDAERAELRALHLSRWQGHPEQPVPAKVEPATSWLPGFKRG